MTSNSPLQLLLSGGEHTVQTLSFRAVTRSAFADASCSFEPNISEKRARSPSPERTKMLSASSGHSGGGAMPAAPAAPPPSEKRKVHFHFESPSVSPARSEAGRPDDAQQLFNHISSAFPQHQSVAQSLATAEQCQQHVAQLLAQAKKPTFVPLKRSHFARHLAESCVQLMLKLDSLSGHSYCIPNLITRTHPHHCHSSRRTAAVISQASAVGVREHCR
jgi:hypothetical protein